MTLIIYTSNIFNIVKPIVKKNSSNIVKLR